MNFKPTFLPILIFLLILPFFKCSMDLGIEPKEENEEKRTYPFNHYNANIPPGKLPWPHHDPKIDQAQYDDLIRGLWIINNFGQYQGGDTKESVYFHDGLDIVLSNGTEIFAVDSGYVRFIHDGGPYYTTVVVEDKNNPGFSWVYTHVYDINVKIGDYLPQGTHIANVNFQGLAHIHLGRAYISEEGSWNNMSDWHYVQPDTFFVFEDTQPPVIEKPFYYFKNNSDISFPHKDTTVISGDVDIVVGIRDRGEYAHSKDTYFGDRLCISRIEYEISGENIDTIYKKSFDFSKIILKTRPEFGLRDYEHISTVYKFYITIHPEGVKSWDKIFSYYVITNTDGSGEFEQIDPSFKSYAWFTDEKNQSGDQLFPNGKYTIKVTTYDFKGNSVAETENVVIAN